MTRYEVRPPSGEDDIRVYQEAVHQAFIGNRADFERQVEKAVPDDIRLVCAKRSIAGGLTLYRMGQWFGGRSVRMAGIAGVTITPPYRAHGAGSALMRTVLEEMHGEGFPLSALFPATQPIYRRAGYELAGLYIRYKVPTRHIDTRSRDLALHPIDKPDDAIQALYGSRAARNSGHLDRNDRIWERVFEAPQDDVVYAYAVDGGYAVFTQKREQSFRYDLYVRDLVFTTPEAGRRLLTMFADHRSMSENVRFVGAPADPLLHLLAEQDYEMSKGITWMLRVVDVRGALEARGWPAGVKADVHLDVRDDVLPWNNGRFAVEIADGKAKVRKGGRGRIRLDMRALASMYSGHMSPSALVLTGQLDAPEKDLAVASAAFAGPAPWLPDFF